MGFVSSSDSLLDDGTFLEYCLAGWSHLARSRGVDVIVDVVVWGSCCSCYRCCSGMYWCFSDLFSSPLIQRVDDADGNELNNLGYSRQFLSTYVPPAGQVPGTVNPQDHGRGGCVPCC